MFEPEPYFPIFTIFKVLVHMPLTVFFTFSHDYIFHNFYEMFDFAILFNI